MSTKKPQAHGRALLYDPGLNKGTGFTEKERDALKLRGLVPPRFFTQDQQTRRIRENFDRKSSDLDRYIFLTALMDRNERLFYRTVMDNIEEMMPIIYTPTVGEACKRYAHIFQRPRGLYVSAKDRGRVRELLHNWGQEVAVIVVTDGERILGLGDLGASGMGIPVGKLSLYTACAGIDPALCLPVMLDVGTENEDHLNDPLYLGLGQRRVRGEEYDSLVDEFVMAADECFDHPLIQFEDFSGANATRFLEKYQDRVCTFNDDIQGTAAVALAGILSSLRITGGNLADQKILFLGAGAAGIGIADLISDTLQKKGLPEAEARKRCWLMDSKGLIVKSRTGLSPKKKSYAHDHPEVPDLLSAVKALRPTALIGVSGQGQVFSQPVIESLSQVTPRPIIFALSNPTSQSECTAEQAYLWSKGKAVFASGSPFPPFTMGKQTLVPGQGNNAYIFPGLGLGVHSSRAKRVTREMFHAAAQALVESVSQDRLDQGAIFPSFQEIREVSAKIAEAVFRVAVDQNLSRMELPQDLPHFIRSQMYQPTYPDFA